MTLLHLAVPTVTRPTRTRKWPGPFWPFVPRGGKTGEGARLHRAAVAGQILAAACVEVQWEGSGSRLAGRQSEFGVAERRGLTGWSWAWQSGSSAGEK
jgi:hypothetical protein